MYFIDLNLGNVCVAAASKEGIKSRNKPLKNVKTSQNTNKTAIQQFENIHIEIPINSKQNIKQDIIYIKCVRNGILNTLE